MSGADDVVKLALKMIAGGAKEAAPKAKLPMDLDNRMYRASEMGFDPTRRYYHLTRKDFDAFKLGADPSSHTGGGAIWLRDDPRNNISAHQVPSFEAEGARDIPLFIRPTKELPTMEWSLLHQQGKLNDQFPLMVTPEENKMLRDMGYSHASIGGETVVFDPKDLRSPHAVFDPDEAESADYMKSSGGSIREGYGPGGWVDDIVKMAGKVVSGEGDDAAKAGIRAYQGSPHNFAAERLVRFPTGKEEYLVGQPDVLPDVPEGAEVVQDFPLGRMRMDKIGTGEGAQAYGHGLYAAENERIARSYRDALATGVKPELRPTDKYSTVGWKAEAEKLFPNDSERQAAFHLFNQMKNKDYVLENYDFITSLPHNQGKPYEWEGVEFTRDRLAQLADEFYDPGHMYEVNINADPNAFLDWDKPLSEQPENVLNVARPFFSEGLPERKQYGEIAKGGDLYDMLVQRSGGVMHGPKLDAAGIPSQLPGGTKERLGMYLSSQGIPGIKYLDAGSRGAGEGTRNYVVFDDKLISIIRKYGIAGASAMLGYNLMEQLDPKQALAASMADQDYKSSRPQRSMGGNNSISGALNVARGLNGGK